MSLVKERAVDCEEALGGDAHDEERLPAEEDVLEGVEEVGQNQDIKCGRQLGGEVWVAKLYIIDIILATGIFWIFLEIC